MRIPDDPRTRPTTTQAATPSVRSTTARTNEAPRRAENGSATTVHISAEARRLSAASPPVDLAKVHKLREALATNTFAVQPSRIAHAMLEAAA